MDFRMEKMILWDVVGIVLMVKYFLPRMEHILALFYFFSFLLFLYEIIFILCYIILFYFLISQRYQGTAFKNVHGNFCPVIGLGSPGCAFSANFGQSPFVYDDLPALILSCKERAQIDNAGHLVYF